MKYLLRHPLTFVLVGLVVLFVLFFVVLPALSLLLHLVIAAAIVWAGLSLLRSYRRHTGARRRSRA